MIIQAFPSGPLATNSYIIACPKTKACAVIDPAPESAAILTKYISENNLKPEKILLTHSHWDHIADVSILKQSHNMPVYIHPLDSPNLEKPGADSLPCWIAIYGVKPDGFLDEGDKITVGQLVLTVIHTPGHTPGGVCFYIPEHNVLISGDTLFKGSIGNISFPTSRPDLMWNSLKKLSSLPPKTRVFPGHGPSTTIERESWLGSVQE